ncbi:MAG: hypothetical protein AVDCRST_MAG32-2894 [uncultured Nocardioides sp.]|uniref:Glutamine amidotransferase domain-containing protein n=1 Tax=uncultured Nocardioides sp. TaxID=198441 RepID=A0A6J4P378_9ACTN|nr:MAG: hypothetical protein AVDCRST_MAG32-2894 [uncultured Nocardioides sp.]
MVVEHQQNCPAGLVGDWLVEAGASLDVVRPYLGDELPEPATYDALLVLGGDMGANDDATVPWLGPLKKHVHATVAAGTPVLGICLGHQLVAAALGGVVGKNPAGLTVGVEPVVWEAAVADDPLFGGMVHADRVVHWNGDVVVAPPPGSTTLARTVDGSVQAARFAAAAWGIQAHPEVDAATCRQWAEVDRDDHLARGLDQDAMIDRIRAAEEELERQWRPLGERFARIAERSVGPRPTP